MPQVAEARPRRPPNPLALALRASGFADLGHALRVLYVEERNSIEDTARLLSVGRGRARALLIEHGFELRPAGQNSPAGRRSHVVLNERAAAERVVAADIRLWLRERTAQHCVIWRRPRAQRAVGGSVTAHCLTVPRPDSLDSAGLPLLSRTLQLSAQHASHRRLSSGGRGLRYASSL